MADENGAGKSPTAIPLLTEMQHNGSNLTIAWPLADAALEQELLDLVQSCQRKTYPLL